MVDMTTRKPFLLTDVDGVLNPWQKITRKGHTAGPDFTKHYIPQPTGPLAVLLSDVHKTYLQKLMNKYEIVWATSWMHEANQHLSPLLGIPNDLKVIEFPEPVNGKHEFPEGMNGSTKTRHIAQWLTEVDPTRPWVWIDDEINKYDRAWFHKNWYNTHPVVSFMTVRINRKTTLSYKDYVRVKDWEPEN